jgi:hypothetical protein
LEHVELKSKRAKAYSDVDGLKMYSGLPVMALFSVPQPLWLDGYMGNDHVLLYQRKLPTMETCGRKGKWGGGGGSARRPRTREGNTQQRERERERKHHQNLGSGPRCWFIPRYKHLGFKKPKYLILPIP